MAQNRVKVANLCLELDDIEVYPFPPETNPRLQVKEAEAVALGFPEPGLLARKYEKKHRANGGAQESHAYLFVRLERAQNPAFEFFIGTGREFGMCPHTFEQTDVIKKVSIPLEDFVAAGFSRESENVDPQEFAKRLTLILKERLKGIVDANDTFFSAAASCAYNSYIHSANAMFRVLCERRDGKRIPFNETWLLASFKGKDAERGKARLGRTPLGHLEISPSVH